MVSEGHRALSGLCGHCYGVTWVPSKIHMLKPYPLVPQNVTVFGDRAFKGVIKVN